LADATTERVLPAVFEIASKHIASTEVVLPSAARTKEARKAFEASVPFDGSAAIGDLINAAWYIYKDNIAEYSDDGRRCEEVLADLVLKSIEIHELRKYSP
jgi:hypothetical protein